MITDEATHLDRIRRLREDIALIVLHAKTLTVKQKWSLHMKHLDELMEVIKSEE